jgi:uncharacterized protein YecE (DUF72 family)
MGSMNLAFILDPSANDMSTVYSGNRMIRVGTAGWLYRDWTGIVYPKPRPRGFDELSYMASFFDTVEINTSFYGPPRPEVAQGWVNRVVDNPRFRFTAKLWKGFTHDRNATEEDEQLFKRGIEPLLASDRLGSVLMQFPWSFRNEPENRAHVRKLRDQFADYPLVLEVRHGSWTEPDVLDELADMNIGLCNIDQPLFQRSVRPAAVTTSAVGYVRLHGRNYSQWFSKKANVRERYDYLYSAEELEPWADRVRIVAEDAQDTYVVTNNHNLGKAVVNAFQLRAFLSDWSPPPPQQLVEKYPELRGLR